MHIRNASVSLKQKTTTAKELNYSPLPRSFNIFLNRITNLPEITDDVYTFCKQLSCFCICHLKHADPTRHCLHVHFIIALL